MIKILNPGVVVRKTQTATCRVCGCVFTYEPSDIKADDQPCSSPYVVCPETGCGQRVDSMPKPVSRERSRPYQ